MRVVLVFFAILLIVVWPKLLQSRRVLPFAPIFVLPLSLCLLAVFGAHRYLTRMTSWPAGAIAIWLGGIVLSAVFLLLTFVPPHSLTAMLRQTKGALLLAAVGSLLAILFLRGADVLWNAPAGHITGFLQRSTFDITGSLLRRFYPGTISSPETYTLTLPHFEGTIATACSGVEGLTLMLMFSVGWLWYARASLRFPQSLLLIPSSLALIWTLNIARIVGLMLIGNSGHPEIASTGFHSEAGWIAFNFVAIAILLASTRIQWFLRHPTDADTAEPAEVSNSVAAYLAPFLSILVAGLFTKAVSSGFEWAYPVRLITAGLVLWHYRRQFRKESFSCSTQSVVVGLSVCALWIAWGRFFPAPNGAALGGSLLQLSAPSRMLWIAARVLAAAITVPIAEELAFRGYLMRRVAAADFQSISYRGVPIYALLLASLVFGAMHGRFWIPGVIAGIAYGWIVRRNNNLGDGIWAHGITNAGIALWVLLFKDWSLW